MADPNLEIGPDYAGAEFAPILEDLGIGEDADELQLEILERLTEAWHAQRAARADAWNTRRAREAREAEEMEQLRQQQLQQEQQAGAEEAERDRLEAERKKPKMNPINPGTSAPDVLSIPPSQYALQKLASFDFVELWYFSLPGRLDAAKHSNKSQADDAFGLTKIEDHLTVRSIASVRASKNVLQDQELPLVDFLQARNTFMDYAKKADWPNVNLDSLSKFFWYLETHPLLHVPLGVKTVLTYAARVRYHWHREVKAGRGYDIAIINSRLLNTISDEIRALDEQQTKTQASRLLKWLIVPR